MDKIKAKFLLGPKPPPSTLAAIRDQYPDLVRDDVQMQFQVFELDYKGKIIYASWSGGKMGADKKPQLTLVGQAAFEALLSSDLGNKEQVFFVEMKLGPTPLLTKISQVLDQIPDQGRVCMFGDLTTELDGQVAELFDLQGFKEV